MKIKIQISLDRKWVRRDAKQYLGFFKGYINQISGLRVLSAILEEE